MDLVEGWDERVRISASDRVDRRVRVRVIESWKLTSCAIYSRGVQFVDNVEAVGFSAEMAGVATLTLAAVAWMTRIALASMTFTASSLLFAHGRLVEKRRFGVAAGLPAGVLLRAGEDVEFLGGILTAHRRTNNAAYTATVFFRTRRSTGRSAIRARLGLRRRRTYLRSQRPVGWIKGLSIFTGW